MGLAVSAVKYVLDALQTNFDGVVADAGGDYTTIQAADDDLDAADFSLLVRTGTYAGWTTSTDDAYIVLGPGVTITSTIVLTGDNVTLIIGPGCDIQGRLDLTGVGCHVICQNACDLDGVLMDGNFGYFSGGGWDTLVDGGTARHAVSITGTDCVVENVAAQTTAGGASAFDGVSISGGTSRVTVRKVKVVDSDDRGIDVNGADGVVEGCVILGADDFGIVVNSPRNRIIGNWITAAGGDGIRVGASGDNSLIVGNVIQDTVAANPIELSVNGNDCVVVGNRLDGAVTDGSTGSTVADNDTEAF